MHTLLDHTILRLLEAQKEVTEVQKSENLSNLYLISKWGFDGSSSQSEYKQTFDEEFQSDASIFLTSYLSKLVSGEPNIDRKNIILWQNSRTSSTRFCRPIKFQFIYETSEISIKGKQYNENQIQELKPSTCNIYDNNIHIRYKLLFTIVVGKVCNSITGTKSTQRCYICGLISKDFNDLEKVFDVKIDTSKLSMRLDFAWLDSFF